MGKIKDFFAPKQPIDLKNQWQKDENASESQRQKDQDNSWDSIGTLFSLIIWGGALYIGYWIIKAIIGFIKYYSRFA